MQKGRKYIQKVYIMSEYFVISCFSFLYRIWKKLVRYRYYKSQIC
jgi:hypothetical protein